MLGGNDHFQNEQISLGKFPERDLEWAAPGTLQRDVRAIESYRLQAGNLIEPEPQRLGGTVDWRTPESTREANPASPAGRTQEGQGDPAGLRLWVVKVGPFPASAEPNGVFGHVFSVAGWRAQARGTPLEIASTVPEKQSSI
jgi:hypothetical protein